MKKIAVVSSFDLDDQQLIYNNLCKLDPENISIVLPSNKRPNERNIIMMAESLGLSVVLGLDEFNSAPEKIAIQNET